MEVTKEQFFDFIGGRADEQVTTRIAAALDDPRSDVCRWFRQIEAAAERPFDIDWAALDAASGDDSTGDVTPAGLRSA